VSIRREQSALSLGSYDEEEFEGDDNSAAGATVLAFRGLDGIPFVFKS
jgi:hypothetical protein